jgi:hypothetical protein
VKRGVTHAPVTLLFAAALTGCAYIGAPQSPTLDIPAKITDLVAAEYGDNVRVQFTVPVLTTEGLPLKNIKSVELRAGFGPNPFSIYAWADGAQRFDVPALGTGLLGRTIPINPDWIGKEIVLAVHATGPKGKTSDWSNLVILSIRTPLPQPANLKAENADQAVRLTWQGSSGHYRIFRAEGGRQPQQLAEADAPEYLDTTAQEGKTYQYLVQATGPDLQQSDVSRLLPQSRRLPVGVSRPHQCAGIHPADRAGRYTDAYMLNRESNVFPGILGRTCDRPCEPACRRGRLDGKPVAICRLKRVAADLRATSATCCRRIPDEEERQARRLHRRGSRVAHGGQRPDAARLRVGHRSSKSTTSPAA